MHMDERNDYRLDIPRTGVCCIANKSYVSFSHYVGKYFDFPIRKFHMSNEKVVGLTNLKFSVLFLFFHFLPNIYLHILCKKGTYYKITFGQHCRNPSISKSLKGITGAYTIIGYNIPCCSGWT